MKKEIGSVIKEGFYAGWIVMGYVYYEKDLFYVCVRESDGMQKDVWNGDIR